MPLRMNDADALPRMALVAAFGLACLSVALQGTGLGTAFVMFLLLILLLPVLALAVCGFPLLLVGRTDLMRWVSSWILLLAGLGALGLVGFAMLSAADVVQATH